jgi:hypothetical protein
MAGVGKDIKPAINLSAATAISVKLKAVSSTPIPVGQTLQARIYIKTDTAQYVWAAPEGLTAFTDLVLDNWVKVSIPVAQFTQTSGSPKWTEFTQIGLQFSTYGGLVYTGKIQIDSVLAATGAGALMISDFEDIVHGWKEQDVGGTLGAVITSITVPGGPDLRASGGGMKLTIEGLDGKQVGTSWPNQTAVGKQIVPLDISGNNTIGVLVYADQAIPAGSALQARIYIKTGTTWVWSTTKNYTDLAGKQWNTLVAKKSDLVQTDGSPIADPTMVKEIGIQLFTWNHTFTGTIYVDNFFTDEETIFGFDDILGWAEVDVGQTKNVVLKKIELVPDVAAITGVGVIRAALPGRASKQMAVTATPGGKMTIRYAVTGPGAVAAQLFAPNGALAATLFTGAATGPSALNWTGMAPVGSGTYYARVTGPGINATQMIRVLK